MSKKRKIEPQGDYILLVPDIPKGGTFEVKDFINESATIEAVGPLVSENVKKLIGKRVIFNSAFCDEKSIDGQKYYFATESANLICATIS